MNRVEEIKVKVENKAGKESGISSGGMHIPGMKIGTQMSPGGPTFEDVIFLVEKIQKCKAFISTAEYSTKEDLNKAKNLFKEIEEGK